jgi:hypothetical protein
MCQVHFRGVERFEVDVIWVEDTTFASDAVVGEDKVVISARGFAEDLGADVLFLRFPGSRGVLTFSIFRRQEVYFLINRTKVASKKAYTTCHQRSLEEGVYKSIQPHCSGDPFQQKLDSIGVLEVVALDIPLRCPNKLCDPFGLVKYCWNHLRCRTSIPHNDDILIRQ